MIDKLIFKIFKSVPQTAISNQLTSTVNATSVTWNPWGLMLVRNIVRYHFPRPDERKRIKKHGWFARMATLNGRRILQRRILKGKHVLSH
ncbi:large ribosomal subunit protein bL34m [Linepithema humile]|uniref:large ribosomal subunit protein bL34m n=1 Tax=Linepithema humile TaxID=83485 RepID=UPI0006230E1A|nr:PREDICTED: 39S ribosomal protein L34, mitochondrial [Linepithema humile]